MNTSRGQLLHSKFDEQAIKQKSHGAEYTRGSVLDTTVKKAKSNQAHSDNYHLHVPTILQHSFNAPPFLQI